MSNNDNPQSNINQFDTDMRDGQQHGTVATGSSSGLTSTTPQASLIGFDASTTNLLVACTQAGDTAYPEGSIWTPGQTNGNPIPAACLKLLQLAMRDFGVTPDLKGFVTARDIYYAVTKNMRLDTLTIAGGVRELKTYSAFWKQLGKKAAAQVSGFMGVTRQKVLFISSLIHHIHTSKDITGTVDTRTKTVPSFEKDTDFWRLVAIAQLLSLSGRIGSRAKQTANRAKQRQVALAAKREKDGKTTQANQPKVDKNDPFGSLSKKQKAKIVSMFTPKQQTVRREPTEVRAFVSGVITNKVKVKTRGLRSSASQISKTLVILNQLASSQDAIIQKIAKAIISCFRSCKNDVRFKDLKTLLYRTREHIYRACMAALKDHWGIGKNTCVLTPEYVFWSLFPNQTPVWVKERHHYMTVGKLNEKLPETIDDNNKWVPDPNQSQMLWLTPSYAPPSKRRFARTKPVKGANTTYVAFSQNELPALVETPVVSIHQEGNKSIPVVKQDTDDDYNAAKAALVALLNQHRARVDLSSLYAALGVNPPVATTEPMTTDSSAAQV
jgi:hypothetical protein